MKITIDHTAGFCTGVTHSIRIAEEELEKGKPLFCLGEIIHNEQELNRLRGMGLQTIDLAAFRQLKDARVLIRAHGEPPETYSIARDNNITLIDTTCRVVHNLQNKIREDHARLFAEGAQVVIIGKKDHPEIIGLNGQIPGGATIISRESDLLQVDFRKPVLMYIQTTFNLHQFETIRDKALRHSFGIPEDERGKVFIYNTICKQVRKREQALRDFARSHDVVVFISDPKSSNGKYLFSICRDNNPFSFFITEPDEMQAGWFSSAQSAGITGATSTPWWLIQNVAEKLSEIVSSQQD